MHVLIWGFMMGSGALIECSPAQEFKIKEIIAIRSPVTFICRVSDWSQVGPARLTVTIRGLEVPDVAADQSKRFLTEILNQSHTIRLSNIEMGSYFRLVADVQTDGKDLAGILIDRQFARKTAPVESISKTVAPSSATKISGLGVQSRSVPARAPSVDPSGTRIIRIDLQSLMDRSVDLSSITPTTPFRDALEIVRNSTNPALPMVINWNDLKQNAFIDETNPVGIDGLRRMEIGPALELICNAVDGGRGEVAFAPRGRVLVVATRRSLGNARSLRVYDIAELTAPPSTGYGMNSMNGGYGMNNMNGGYGTGNGMSGMLGNQLSGGISNLTSGSNR